MILNYFLKLFLDEETSKNEHNTPEQGGEFCTYKGYKKYSINCMS